MTPGLDLNTKYMKYSLANSKFHLSGERLSFIFNFEFQMKIALPSRTSVRYCKFQSDQFLRTRNLQHLTNEGQREYSNINLTLLIYKGPFRHFGTNKLTGHLT